MQNGKILNNKEKWNLVQELLVEGKTYREIESIVHVSPNFITKVKIAEFGQNSVENNEKLKKNKKISKRTQAIDLFYTDKTPKEVLVELDIGVDEVKKAKQDHLQLLNFDNLSQIIQPNNGNLLKEFYNLFMIFKELGINTIGKVRAIKDMVETYPNLTYQISNLNKDIHNLKIKKENGEQVLNDIEYKISLANASHKEIKDQIQNDKIIIQNLECLISKMKSPEVFHKFKQIIDPIIKDEFWYKANVLPLLMISVFEVLRNDPMGKNMILDYYYNNPESIFSNKNSKGTDIENITNYIYYNYLTIIMDINEYSRKLHDNICIIYPIYLFSKVLKLPHFDNSNSVQDNLQDCEINNHNQFWPWIK